MLMGNQEVPYTDLVFKELTAYEPSAKEMKRKQEEDMWVILLKQ